MRKFTSTQGELGENPLLGVIIIENIKLDPNCRDEITKTLRGLKEIYREKPLLKKIEMVLHKLIPEGISWDEGRQGMWSTSVIIFFSLKKRN